MERRCILGDVKLDQNGIRIAGVWDSERSKDPSKETSGMNKQEVLAKLASGEIKVEEASKLLAELEPKRGSLSCRVSEKGGISVYGLQKMPVTLYVEQWEKLLGFADELREFMKEHDAELKRKGQAKD
jgi:hypothetical protein